MQELRQESNDRKKCKSKVGTIYCEKLNFSKHIPAFDSSNIPIRAKQIKSEVKLSILPDILETKPAKWNPSVLFDGTKEYSDQVAVSKLHFEIRKGIRDVSLPRPAYSKIYQGVDSRNESSNWNISVQFDENEHKKTHLVVNELARNHSAQRRREILENSKYVKPFQRQVNLLKDSRRAKEQDLEIKSDLMKDVVHVNPDISKEKATAVVNRILVTQREKTMQEGFYGVKAENFKPHLKTHNKKNLVRRARHDGVFQLNEFIEKTVWSCCGNEEESSPGCIITYKDLEKWQLISL